MGGPGARNQGPRVPRGTRCRGRGVLACASALLVPPSMRARPGLFSFSSGHLFLLALQDIVGWRTSERTNPFGSRMHASVMAEAAAQAPEEAETLR